MKTREDRLRRGTHSNVEIGPVRDRQFTITATWHNGSFEKSYDQGVFIPMGTRRGIKLKKKHCRFADEFIREVLRKRGVIR